MQRLLKRAFCLACAGVGLLAGLPATATAQSHVVSESLWRTLNTVCPSVLAGHVSFLSSDHLLGRPFGSSGEIIAAEYIASQFRSIGLRDVGENGFFQLIRLQRGSMNEESWRLAFTLDGSVTSVSTAQTSIGPDALQLVEAPIVKVVEEQLDRSSAEGLEVDGAAVLTLGGFALTSRLLRRGFGLRRALREEMTDSERLRIQRELEDLDANARRVHELRLEFLSAIEEKGALVHFDASEDGQDQTWVWKGERIWDPTEEWIGERRYFVGSRGLPTVRIFSESLFSIFDSLPDGLTRGSVDLNLSAPSGELVETVNVIGLIPGSDSELSNEFVLVTAHFDGQGIWSGYPGDSILNSANDNATGVAGLIEVARILNSLSESPRRSLLFVALSGEEKGLLGSKYFIKNPLVPLERIAAVVNLEELGRTDDLDEGEQIRTIAITGFNYSTMHRAFEAAGERVGVDVVELGRSDDFFRRSDNASFADVGIPAHTLSATYSYSDYHGNEDHWNKIDYENMAHLTRAIALGVWFLANDETGPRWNGGDPEVDRYLRAWQELHGVGR